MGHERETAAVGAFPSLIYNDECRSSICPTKTDMNRTSDSDTGFSHGHEWRSSAIDEHSEYDLKPRLFGPDCSRRCKQQSDREHVLKRERTEAIELVRESISVLEAAEQKLLHGADGVRHALPRLLALRNHLQDELQDIGLWSTPKLSTRIEQNKRSLSPPPVVRRVSSAGTLRSDAAPAAGDLSGISGFIIDLDGTMYNPSGPIDGADAFYSYLINKRIP
eukprot:3985495-Pleurochrysis_carterae.AAC.2